MIRQMRSRWIWFFGISAMYFVSRALVTALWGV